MVGMYGKREGVEEAGRFAGCTLVDVAADSSHEMPDFVDWRFQRTPVAEVVVHAETTAHRHVVDSHVRLLVEQLGQTRLHAVGDTRIGLAIECTTTASLSLTPWPVCVCLYVLFAIHTALLPGHNEIVAILPCVNPCWITLLNTHFLVVLVAITETVDGTASAQTTDSSWIDMSVDEILLPSGHTIPRSQ